jgi:hypothetical protein
MGQWKGRWRGAFTKATHITSEKIDNTLVIAKSRLMLANLREEHIHVLVSQHVPPLPPPPPAPAAAARYCWCYCDKPGLGEHLGVYIYLLAEVQLHSTICILIQPHGHLTVAAVGKLIILVTSLGGQAAALYT